MTNKTLFPITAAQRAKGRLNSEGAEAIALLQDLNFTATPADMRSQLLTDSTAGNIFDFSGLLAGALDNEHNFAQLYSDELMHDYRASINGARLPGLRQDAAGDWQRVAPDDATVNERREYVRRKLIVNAAKRILGATRRQATDQIAVTQPRALQSICCLANIAKDVCRRFDPQFMQEFDAMMPAAV